MTDPHRLLSGLSDADDLERELLGSLRHVDPPAGAKGEAWTKLSVQLAAVGLVSVAGVQGTATASLASSAVTPATAGATGTSLVGLPAALKGLLGKLLLGVALTGTASALWVHTRREPPAPVTVSAAALASVQSPVSAASPEPSVEAPAHSAAQAVEPSPPESPVKPSNEASREDRLSAESKLLTRARAELRRGDSATAQQTLDQIRVKFPNGVLGQEREVLSIEVLAARGNRDAAGRRARAFIAAYPKSPHSAQLARFTDSP